MPDAAPLGARERLEARVARFLLALPAPLQRLLAGGRAVRRDGQTLEPEVQLLLRLLALSGGRSFETLPPPEARREIAGTARAFAGPPLPMARVETLSLPGPGGPVPARLYLPPGLAAPRPLLVYYHGGGWVLCDLDTHDEPCRFLATEARVAVLSVDYRLAPEHRFPAAVEDALAAFHFAAEQATDLGVDAARIAVGGDSAGGNLAAVVAQLARAEGAGQPAFQLLFYPVTDLSTKHPSYSLFSDGFFLTERQMDWYRGHYLPDEAAARDPRASPLLAADLTGLPPAYVATAGFDPLRDEGEAYAARLRDAGVPTTLHRHAGLIHGFCNVLSLGRRAREAMTGAARALGQALAR
jgi:acetyl esterase